MNSFAFPNLSKRGIAPAEKKRERERHTHTCRDIKRRWSYTDRFGFNADGSGNCFLFGLCKPDPRSAWEIFHQPWNGAAITVRAVKSFVTSTMLFMFRLYGSSNDTDNESGCQGQLKNVVRGEENTYLLLVFRPIQKKIHTTICF